MDLSLEYSNFSVYRNMIFVHVHVRVEARIFFYIPCNFNFIFSVCHYLSDYLTPSEPVLLSSSEGSFESIAIVV